MKLTKTALNKFIKWTTSRYNELSKKEAVRLAYDLLSGIRTDYEAIVISCGSYTPSSAMTHGRSYLINVQEKSISDVRAYWDFKNRKTIVLETYDKIVFDNKQTS